MMQKYSSTVVSLWYVLFKAGLFLQTQRSFSYRIKYILGQLRASCISNSLPLTLPYFYLHPPHLHISERKLKKLKSEVFRALWRIAEGWCQWPKDQASASLCPCWWFCPPPWPPNHWSSTLLSMHRCSTRPKHRGSTIQKHRCSTIQKYWCSTLLIQV